MFNHPEKCQLCEAAKATKTADVIVGGNRVGVLYICEDCKGQK